MKKLSTPIVITLTFIGSVVCLAATPPGEYRQNEVKAAFLYNFLLYSERPQNASAEFKDSIVIGILGKDTFGDAFDPIEGELANGKELVIKRFESNAPADSLKQCDLLFISSSLRNQVKDLLVLLKGHPVLTVSEVGGFLEIGGMINFVVKRNRLMFEINNAVAARSGIKIRSKLLRLAVRVVEDDDAENGGEQQG
jgi:uncharacterized protein DUF4154